MRFRIGDRVKIIKRVVDNRTGYLDFDKTNGDVCRVGIISRTYDDVRYRVVLDKKIMSRSLGTLVDYIGVFTDIEIRLEERSCNDINKLFMNAGVKATPTPTLPNNLKYELYHLSLS